MRPPTKTNNSRSQDNSEADLLLSKEVHSTHNNDSVFCTDDKVLEELLEDDEEEIISPPEYAAQAAMRLSSTIACSRLTVDNVLSIGYHIVDAVQKKLTILKSNVNFLQNLQGRITLYDDSVTKNMEELEMDMDDKNNAVSSTFTQCNTDSRDAFNFQRTLNAEDFE